MSIHTLITLLAIFEFILGVALGVMIGKGLQKDKENRNVVELSEKEKEKLSKLNKVDVDDCLDRR